MNKAQRQAVKCALADLEGSLRAHESKGRLSGHNWYAHRASIADIKEAFSNVFNDEPTEDQIELCHRIGQRIGCAPADEYGQPLFEKSAAVAEKFIEDFISLSLGNELPFVFNEDEENPVILKVTSEGIVVDVMENDEVISTGYMFVSDLQDITH